MTDIVMGAPEYVAGSTPDIRTVPLTALRDDACTNWRLTQYAARTVDAWRTQVTQKELQTIRSEVPENIRIESFRRDASDEVFARLKRAGVREDVAVLAILDDVSLVRLERVL